MTPEQQQKAEAYLAMLRALEPTCDRGMFTAFLVAHHLGEAVNPVVSDADRERNHQAVAPHARRLAWLAQQGALEVVRLPQHLIEPGLACYRVL